MQNLVLGAITTILWNVLNHENFRKVNANCDSARDLPAIVEVICSHFISASLFVKQERRFPLYTVFTEDYFILSNIFPQVTDWEMLDSLSEQVVPFPMSTASEGTNSTEGREEGASNPISQLDVSGVAH